MPAIKHRLEHCLILLDDYLHPLFGAPTDSPASFKVLKEQLGEGLSEGFDSTGRSYLIQRLRTQYRGVLSDLETYDDNIKRHLDRINVNRPQDEQIVFKYFQHLALFYTEHVLHRLFTDADDFIVQLNKLVEKHNEQLGRRETQFEVFTPADLTKLAYWMATGSGKTLLLHINYHQILHYACEAKQSPFENILLITPKEGLSTQHLQELERSGIPARLFRQGEGQVPEGTVQIIEITKFTEGTSGPQTINVGAFEGHNLIFVDEGHRGASGDVWVNYRDKLAKDGFTFEYSATFGEAFNSGNSAADITTRHTYGKSVVFDYSYRYFYADGYGKDYSILNLPEDFNPDNRDTLLLANLLTIYEQAKVYAEHEADLRAYSIEPPLLMFIGHTVQAGKTKTNLTSEDKKSLSDVQDIVRFLQRVTSQSAWVQETIDAILTGNTGLQDSAGADIFADKFPILQKQPNAELHYKELLKHVFHAENGGAIHLASLRNATGEISLRVGASEIPFGVINIGDDSNFITMVEEADLDVMVDPPDAFRGSLFNTINHTGSSINILVGAKKFTEGWSSWRVSGMGLLNVGRSEGSEVIQMFGRGVRLKGYAQSLKRSSELKEMLHPDYLPLLETLNIFSINGGYLSQFRAALDRENIPDYQEIHIPIKFPVFEHERPKLYTIRPRGDRRFVDEPTFALELDSDDAVKPVIDLRPVVGVLASVQADGSVKVDETPTIITPSILALLDWDTLYTELLTWRRQRGFHNLAINRQVVPEILAVLKNGGQEVTPFYTLYAPQQMTTPRRFADVPLLQRLVFQVITKYIERFYLRAQQRWENENLEYRLLDRSDPNLMLSDLDGRGTAGYIIKVSRDEEELMHLVEDLVEQGTHLYSTDQQEFPTLIFDRHLYAPLVAEGFYDGHEFDNRLAFKSVPVALNRGETRFVWKLRDYLHKQRNDLLGARQIYLLRNLSRGKGVGFYDRYNFYPDFILWLVEGTHQTIVFIDPKGLRMLTPANFNNEKVQLYTYLQKELAPRLNNAAVRLDAFIISDKSFVETRKFFGVDPNNNPHTQQEFLDHHILFPETAADTLLSQLIENA
jgi:hypothetical protein